MPEPHHELLVHNNDMTPTLERFYGDLLCLRVCGRDQSNDRYLREVVLSLNGDGRPVEYGVITIRLGVFPEVVRRKILSDEHPFGRILEKEAIAHLGWPQAYFQIHADDRMVQLLEIEKPCRLFGRRNVLLDGDRRLLADVLEILAPPHCGRPHLLS